jgi:hypothetical protein
VPTEYCFSLYFRKNITTCCSVGPLRICPVPSVCCQTVYRWVMTYCCCIIDTRSDLCRTSDPMLKILGHCDQQQLTFCLCGSLHQSLCRGSRQHLDRVPTERTFAWHVAVAAHYFGFLVAITAPYVIRFYITSTAATASWNKWIYAVLHICIGRRNNATQLKYVNRQLNLIWL